LEIAGVPSANYFESEFLKLLSDDISYRNFIPIVMDDIERTPILYGGILDYHLFLSPFDLIYMFDVLNEKSIVRLSLNPPRMLLTQAGSLMEWNSSSLQKCHELLYLDLPEIEPMTILDFHHSFRHVFSVIDRNRNNRNECLALILLAYESDFNSPFHIMPREVMRYILEFTGLKFRNFIARKTTFRYKFQLVAQVYANQLAKTRPLNEDRFVKLLVQHTFDDVELRNFIVSSFDPSLKWDRWPELRIRGWPDVARETNLPFMRHVDDLERELRRSLKDTNAKYADVFEV
jgi:hypothetical protein